MIVDR